MATHVFVVALFQLGLYTVDILGVKKIEIEIQTSIFATKIDKIDRSFYSPDRSNTTCNNTGMQPRFSN